ncbi:hypothetical protein [Acinetobacter sp. 1125_18A]|uniref:hypothetical protein n=1 Tax=Acinetobacter sp. 1125_18A TaxID=2605959 RepID=UPI004058EB09
MSHYSNTPMPKDNAARIVEGKRHLYSFLGERMRTSKPLIRHFGYGAVLLNS